MNFLWRTVLACRMELRIIAIVFAVLFVLPILAVVVIVNGGISEASSALTEFNPVTRRIEVKDANGQKVAEFDSSTAWPAAGYVSDEFGTYATWRRLLGLSSHTGIDIANRTNTSGDPVTTFLQGEVIGTYVTSKGYGNYVVVDHGYNLTSIYAHLSAIEVEQGQDVEPGDLIGRMGTTGNSTGVHLHFEVRVYEVPVNPRVFMVGEPMRGTP